MGSFIEWCSAIQWLQTAILSRHKRGVMLCYTTLPAPYAPTPLGVNCVCAPSRVFDLHRPDNRSNSRSRSERHAHQRQRQPEFSATTRRRHRSADFLALPSEANSGPRRSALGQAPALTRQSIGATV